MVRILDAQAWAEPLGDVYQAIFRPVFALRPIKDLLNGRWLGHPLHPALTDVPIGALLVALVLDLAGTRAAADLATAIGVAAILVAALAGYADYADMSGRRRRHATVHSTLMLLATVAYLLSLAVRFGLAGPFFERSEVWLAAAGFALIAAGAYVGGHLVFATGQGVDRHARRTLGEEWRPLEVGELGEGRPTKARAAGQTLVVVRRGETVQALHDTCAHEGCSLSAGTLVGDGEVECRCHGSRFRLADGAVTRSPAVYDQPAYEVRRTEAGLEARPRR